MATAHNAIYSNESILKKLDVMRVFIDKSPEIIDKYPQEPLPGSKGDKEMTTFPISDLVMDAYVRGTICFESAADHFMAFLSLLQEPIKTLSPYTCVRSLLESSALALWLLDLDIDAEERVGRSFGFRYKEFKEQIKFLEANKLNDPDAQKYIQGVEQRIMQVEAKAIALGYPQLSKAGKITGIATHMPETIRIIKTILNKEPDYRLLSGVVHGYPWATSKFGFHVIEATDTKGKKIKSLEKCFHPEMVIFGINSAVPTITKILWVKGTLFGWDMYEIEGLLNNTFDEIGFNDNLRFWLQS